MRKTHLIRDGMLTWCGAYARKSRSTDSYQTFCAIKPLYRCGSCLRIYFARHCLPPTPEPKGNPPCAPSKRSPTASKK